jgi:hypothetical protein
MPENSSTAVQQRPWQAVVHGSLVRAVGVDQVEEVNYDGEGRFTQRLRLVNGPGPGMSLVLDRAQLRVLLAELHAELAAPGPGIDRVSVDLFARLVEDALRTEPPSLRFDGVRFGAITRDEARGILYGHVTLGVDLVGTVRDERHLLSFEQRIVTGPVGVYRPLSPADAASLARAMAANPPADRLWQVIRQDAEAAASV